MSTVKLTWTEKEPPQCAGTQQMGLGRAPPACPAHAHSVLIQYILTYILLKYICYVQYISIST